MFQWSFSAGLIYPLVSARRYTLLDFRVLYYACMDEEDLEALEELETSEDDSDSEELLACGD